MKKKPRKAREWWVCPTCNKLWDEVGAEKRAYCDRCDDYRLCTSSCVCGWRCRAPIRMAGTFIHNLDGTAHTCGHTCVTPPPQPEAGKDAGRRWTHEAERDVLRATVERAVTLLGRIAPLELLCKRAVAYPRNMEANISAVQHQQAFLAEVRAFLAALTASAAKEEKK